MPVSYDKDIKPLFTQTDHDHMDFMFDLWSYKDVKSNADDIYDAISAGRMPPNAPWPPDKTALFKQWMTDGYQP